MFDGFFIIAYQVVTLFLLIAAGYTVTRAGLLTKSGADQMTNVLLTIVTPSVIINAFEIPFDKSKLMWLCVAAASAVATHILGILIGKPFFKKSSEAKQPVYRYAITYSNCGFMALPLIQAIAGAEGVFYGAVYIVVFNLFAWTHGIMLMSGGKGNISLKRVFINPGVIGTSIALILFFFSLSLPSPVHTAVQMLANLNSPLAMVVIGAFLTNVNFKSALLQKEIYLVSSVRLLAIPLIVIFILHWLNLPEPLFKACVISASAPCAANVSLFASRFLKDTGLAGELVAFTTACSIITMPLLLLLVGIWG